MAEFYSGEITIGGTVTPDIAEEIRQSWNQDGLVHMDTLESMQSHLERSPTDYLEGQKEQTRYGAFEDLENRLRELQVPFTRHSSGFMEFAPEKVEYRPVLEKPIRFMKSDDGLIQISEDKVRSWVTDLEDGQVDTVLLNMRVALGDHIPELPPFKIEAPEHE